MAADLAKNPVFVERLGSFFDVYDLNEDKYLTIEELLKCGKRMGEMCKATPAENMAMERGLQEFWGEVGLTPGKKLTKEEFIHGFSRHAQNELRRKAENKPTLHEKMNNAFFDVCDINNDGTVTLDEAKMIFKAWNLPEEDGAAWFEASDINKNGKVERDELNKSEFNYFHRPDLPSTENFYAKTRKN
ncbi:obelin [Exaiptasia diaphana]|uniref:EF-hand domain-containing protein n=1 Tax=Exaiptasia diaphana TaxID=2652724 RepID=A0A913XER6_EXADI|nr:obelin [Exaiptasia diaphana]